MGNYWWAVFGNTWEVFKWEVLGDGQGGDEGPKREKAKCWSCFCLSKLFGKIKHGHIISSTGRILPLFFFSFKVFFLFFCTVWCVLSCQTRRCLFLGRLRVYTRSDCCSGTVWEPRTLEISWHCFSSNFVYNFNKTPWFPLMWKVRFVTFVHKQCQLISKVLGSHTVPEQQSDHV